MSQHPFKIVLFFFLTISLLTGSLWIAPSQVFGDVATYYPNTAGSTAWKIADDTRPSSALVLDSETAYSGAELNTISTDNTSGVQGGAQLGGTKIRYTLSEAAADITQLDITISVSDEAMGGSGDVSLYIWNFDTTTWDDSGEGVTSSTKSELNYSITSDITDYVDGSGNFYLVVQSAIGGSSHNSLTYYSSLVTQDECGGGGGSVSSQETSYASTAASDPSIIAEGLLGVVLAMLLR